MHRGRWRNVERWDKTVVDRGVTTLKKVVRNASQGRFAGGGAALFKGAPMPKCTILEMQHSTGDT